MTTPPTIVAQLVHIEGPLKGEIQETQAPEILIGRHSSCQIRFPKDFAIVSRKHARIVREGNRFKLTDQSTNGTFLNGKPIAEAYLKSGDVLMFSEGGPKISFLTRITQAAPQPAAPEPPAPQEPQPAPEPPTPSAPTPPPTAPAPEAPAATAPAPSVQSTQSPLIIQYGPTLRSFKTLPISIGRGPGCDVVLDHPELADRHAQIFFDQDQYWVEDLTGENRISINGRPIQSQAPLHPECLLALSPQGPAFRFLGGGRLAEVEP
jgi:pSer/pThr/pTyr-binding forkhead associated (FHA) protein